MSIVIDTTAIIAFYNKDDENHERARKLMQEASKGGFGALVLTDYVFDEAVTLALARNGKKSAKTLGDWLLNSQFQLVYSDGPAFGRAWELFAKTGRLSFTDCVVASTALKANAQVMSFDEHFNGVPGLKVVR